MQYGDLNFFFVIPIMVYVKIQITKVRQTVVCCWGYTIYEGKLYFGHSDSFWQQASNRIG